MNRYFYIIAVYIVMLCNSCQNSDLLSNVSSASAMDENYTLDDFMYSTQNILEREGDNPLIIFGLYSGHKEGIFPYQECRGAEMFGCFLWFPLFQRICEYIRELNEYDQVTSLAVKNESSFRVYIPKINEYFIHDIEQYNGWNILEEIPITDPYSLRNIGSSRTMSILPNVYTIDEESPFAFFQTDISFQYGEVVLVVLSNSSIEPLKYASSIYGEDVLIGYVSETDINGNELTVHIPKNALGNTENILYNSLYDQQLFTLNRDCVFDEPYVREFFSTDSNEQISIVSGNYQVLADCDTIENGIKILCTYNID